MDFDFKGFRDLEVFRDFKGLLGTLRDFEGFEGIWILCSYAQILCLFRKSEILTKIGKNLNFTF